MGFSLGKLLNNAAKEIADVADDVVDKVQDLAVDVANEIGNTASQFFSTLPLHIQWFLNGLWGNGHHPPTSVGTGELAANGVAAGDVTETSAVLWARPLSSTEVNFQVALDAGFTQIVREQTVSATPGEPVHASIDGLTAGEQYHYRAITASGGAASGRFNTAQDQGLHGLTFGVSGDWRGGNTPYAAVSNADEAALDFFVQLGDTIYADRPSPAFPGPQARTLDDFQLRYAETLTERGGANFLVELRQSTAVYAMIDDHEVADDFAGGAPPASDSRFDASPTADFINETELYNNGLQAFHDYQPIEQRSWQSTNDDRVDGSPDLYRSQHYGDDAAVFLVDARTFRDQQLVDPNPVDPADVGRFLAQSFDPSRALLGEPQLERLKADLIAAEQDGVLWKFIMVPEPIQNLGPAAAADRYEGYAAERTELLRFIDEQDIANVVFVSADIHGTVVNNLTYQTSPLGPQIALDAFEISTGSVAFSTPFGTSVMAIAEEAGLLTPLQRALYDILPIAPDRGSDVDDKDDFLKALINQQLDMFGYDRVGLNDNLASSEGLVDAELFAGDYVIAHTFGWSKFDIDPVSHELMVTTYGIQPYTESDAAADPEAIAGRDPVIVSQFVVAPDQHLVGTDGVDDLGGGKGDDTLGGGLGDDIAHGGAGDDFLAGGDGNDVLDGGDGRDTLIGGTGKDVITGAAGPDQFVFMRTDSKLGGSVRDVVTDFASAEDVLDLRALGLSDPVAQISYQTIGSGLILHVDLEQDGLNPADFAVQLTGVSSLAAGDILV